MTTMTSDTLIDKATLPPGQAGPGGGLSAYDILGMLRRRMVLLITLFVLLTALAMAGFFVWWRYFPGHQAYCLIECISDVPESALTAERERLRQDDHERFVRSQAVLMMSPSILGEALKVSAVRETQWYASVPNNEHLLTLLDELSANPVRGTNYLRVAMSCRKPTDPAIIVNTIVRQWYDEVKRRTAEGATAKPLATAREELGALDAQISAKRRELSEIAARLPAGAVQNPADNIVAQQVEQFGQQVAVLQLELAQIEQFRELYNDPESVAVTAEDRAIVEADPQVADQSRLLAALQQQRAADAMIYGPGHRELRRVDAQIGAMESDLAELRERKLLEHMEDVREATNSAFVNKQHALYLTQDELARAKAALQDQDELYFRYRNLDDEIKTDLDYRLDLNNHIKNLSRLVRQQSAVDVNVAQWATDPLEQHSPTPWLIPVGVFLALALSVGTILGLEVLDTSVRTPQDIVRHLDIALLGAVPDVDDEEIAIDRVETAVFDKPLSMVAEAFRRIRVNLQFSAPAQQQRTIVVTSPRPEDGRTTVAVNLAAAIAQNGRRVLLVDANFRRPALHKLFTGIKQEGLSNILVGQASLADSVVSTPVAGLSVLGTGTIPPNPGELLGSDACKRFLAEASSEFNQVIIDTPPTLVASDALVLASEVAGVVLVVRANTASRGVARRACQQLAGVGANIFGAVLNAAQVTRGGYFREQLRTFYEYQEGADRRQLSGPGGGPAAG